MGKLVWVVLAIGLAAVVPAYAEEGVTGSEIRLGQTAPLTGPFATLETASRDGALLYIEHVNGQGGVHGRRIQLLTLDDGYDAGRAAVNATRLVREEKSFALFSVNGTPTALKALEVAEKDGVPFLFPFSGASALRKANRLVFHVRASYAQELERLIELAAGNGASRLAVAYVDNAFGHERLAAAERALAGHGLKAVAKAALDPAAWRLMPANRGWVQILPGSAGP
jgi:ABC-type branched-subunit amino acid transport system substrate-binding protein